ncbi:hypothetical protein GX51_02399 [Blastomyces parvus]|uniref:MOSC domain-containing protein n=1 Tax=Blastomyces parvus TaxID=2060905 RepID=A0A2B7XCL1_9EURO|nr:hypothetical protein GX51_02399 [Blastomyces parvus]
MSVLSVNASPTHSFSKQPVARITLLPNLGVQGDAHAGVTVQHRSRLHITPAPPNLRQVHLIHAEMLAQAGGDGDGEGEGEGPLLPGEMGENITTAGVDLLALGRGTKLRFVGGAAVGSGDGDVDVDNSPDETETETATVTVTGLRNPCAQIDRFRPGLKEKFVVRDGAGKIVGRKAGVMGVVERGGVVRPGMRILVERPAVHEGLECV